VEQAAGEKETAYGLEKTTAQSALPANDPHVVSWRDFIQVTKPGILFSNLITTFGGFWIASQWEIDWLLMVWILAGATLVMASGCVLNNYLDRDLDAKMKRTQNRALPSGTLTPRVVMIYGVFLGIAGLLLLGLLVNMLTALLGLLGLFVYVYVYTAWLKRTSVWSTVVGAVSGAIPPVMGYTAVTGRIDIGALILFMILFLWQPPHFWALGIRRLEDYRKAGYPLLPVVKGIRQTQISMLRYAVPLIPVSVLLYVFDYAGVFYLISAIVLGTVWAFLCARGFRAKDEIRWSKGVFVFSINYLTILFIIMIIDTVGR
jgi:protoheme IX farnesyltransferase